MTPEENQLLEGIKRNPAVLRVYREYLPGMKKEGREYSSSCPLEGHADRTPSFRIYEKDGLYLWTCHSKCGLTGNVVQLVSRLESCSFKEALEKVKEKIGGQWERDSARVQKSFAPIAPPEKKRTFTLAQHAKYEQALAESMTALQWLKNRGIDHAAAQRFHLGFDQDITRFCPGIAEKHPDLIAKGWISIPYIKGDTVHLVQFRSIVSKEAGRVTKMATPTFNIEAPDPLLPVFITEGPWDTICLEMAGFKSVAMYNATQGLSPEDKDAIMDSDSVIIAVDNDEAGVKCAAKLQAELGEKTLTIRWPEKDANDTLLKTCGGDKAKFKELVDKLVTESKSNPMIGVYDLCTAMTQGMEKGAENPARLRFPWPEVDGMIQIAPGNGLALSGTNAGIGKSPFLMNILIHNAVAHRRSILLYSAEQTPAEYGRPVAAHVLHKSLNHLTQADGVEAAKRLGGIQFLIGNNPDLRKAMDVMDLMEAAIRRFSPDIWAIDTLHHICVNEDDQIKAQENVSRRCKDLQSKYSNIGIVVLQPRKAESNKRGKELHVSDPRGAAALMEAVSGGLFIHREKKKRADEGGTSTNADPYEPITRVDQVKGRYLGAASKPYCDLLFLGEFATFVPINNLDKPPEDKLF